MKLAKRILIQFLGTTILFSVVVSVGTSLVLFVASCLGYLSYSDRPGPGWWASMHWPSWGEVGVYLGFVPFFAYFCLFFGAALFVLALLLGLMSTPKWLCRIIGGLISSLAGGLAITGAGWYFALATIGTYAALAAGLIYGVFLFPKFVKLREKKLSLWIRAASVTMASGLFLFWIISPFLPKKPVLQLSYDFTRCNEHGSNPMLPIKTAWADQSLIQSSGLSNQTCHLERAAQGMESGSDNGPGITIHVLFINQPNQNIVAKLPASGEALIVINGGKVTTFPAGLPFSDEKLRIHQDPSGHGFSAKFDGPGRMDRWDWYQWTPITN